MQVARPSEAVQVNSSSLKTVRPVHIPACLKSKTATLCSMAKALRARTDLWSYYGNQGNTYRINNNTQFRVSAIGSGDIGDHALQMGFEYEQRRDGYYMS